MKPTHVKRALQAYVEGRRAAGDGKTSDRDFDMLEASLQDWDPGTSPEYPVRIAELFPPALLADLTAATTPELAVDVARLEGQLAAMDDGAEDSALLELLRRAQDLRAQAAAHEDSGLWARLNDAVATSQRRVTARVEKLYSTYARHHASAETPSAIAAALANLDRILQLDSSHTQARTARTELLKRQQDTRTAERIQALAQRVSRDDALTPEEIAELDRLHDVMRTEGVQRVIGSSPELQAARDVLERYHNSAREGRELRTRFLGNMAATYRQVLADNWAGERRPYGAGRMLSQGETLRSMAEEWGLLVQGRVSHDLRRSKEEADPETRLKMLEAAQQHWQEWYETTLPASLSNEQSQAKADLQRSLELARQQLEAWQRHQNLRKQAARASSPLDRYDLYVDAQRTWAAASGSTYPALDQECKDAARELADHLAREVRPRLSEIERRLERCTEAAALARIRKDYGQLAQHVQMRPVTSPDLESVRASLDKLNAMIASRETLMVALDEVQQLLDAPGTDMGVAQEQIRQLEAAYGVQLPTWHIRVADRQGLDEQLRTARACLDNLDYENALLALQQAPSAHPEAQRLRQRSYLLRGQARMGRQSEWVQARADLRLARQSDEPEVRRQADDSLAELSLMEERQRPINEAVRRAREELGVLHGGEPQGSHRAFGLALASLQAVLTQPGNPEEARALRQQVFSAWEAKLRQLLLDWRAAPKASKVAKTQEALGYVRDNGQLLTATGDDRNLVREVSVSLLRFQAMKARIMAADEERRKQIQLIENILREDVSLFDDFDLLERLVLYCILDEDYERAQR
ncbi:MAG: hypothetical protein ACUVX9_05185 [Anaerolineae bacterium]